MMQKALSAGEGASVARSAESEDIDLFEVFRVLWRGKLWILLCMVVGLAGGWYRGAVLGVPLYTASAEMALVVRSPQTMDLQALVSGVSGDQASINTEMAVVTSGELIGRLVDQLELDQDPEFNAMLPGAAEGPGLLGRLRASVDSALRAVLPGGGDAASAVADEPTAEEIRQGVVSAVQGAFRTESNWDTYVFSIQATTRDREKSALLANSLAALYRDDQIRQKAETAERMAQWLSERIGELRSELDAKQSQIAELQARSALVSDASVQALNQQAIEVRGQLADAQAELARLDTQLAALRGAEAGDDIQAKLTAADDGQLAAAAQALASGDPSAKVRFDRRYAQVVVQAEAAKTRVTQRIGELQASADDLSAQFEQQSADLLALQKLQQDVEATQTLYETFLTRLKEASVQSTAYEADSRLLTSALPGRQVAPRTRAIMGMGMLLGLLAGLAAVLAWEYVQSTFRSPEILEAHTRRPVLGQIPLVPGRRRPDILSYIVSKPTSAAAEAVRNLRTSLLLANASGPPQVIMLTSSVPAEGKTTIAISLAHNLTSMGRRVLLIEGDNRRRTFSNYFRGGADASGSLVSVVAGETTLAESVVRPDNLGADVLMGSKTAMNAADLFSSDAFRALLEEARTRYDHIIIDTPPVLVVPDARVLAQYADSVAYVVRWDDTPKTQVDEGLKAFRSVGVQVTGMVLSQINPKGMRRYGYGGRYGPYSRYAGNYYGN